MSHPGRRMSSLEAAGVKLTSYTTSSSSSTSTTTKKKIISPLNSTNKIARTPFTPSSSPVVSPQRIVKEQTQTKASSNTPSLKRRSTTGKASDLPLPPERDASRASSRRNTASRRYSLANYSPPPTPIDRKVAIAANTNSQLSDDSSIIEELKDKVSLLF